TSASPLQCNVSTSAPRAPDNPMAHTSPQAGSLGVIIRSYKSAVSYWCHHNGYAGFGWQARFYDRIIRNQRALRIVRRYIARNPAKWKNDRYFLNIRETNHHVRRGMSTV
ncbi:MAG: hypothetical protein NZQ09_17400, partial [Chloroflexus sp.]|nr:hypothetical protein [Chloroflexus sp.]